MKKIILPFCALLATAQPVFAEDDVTQIIDQSKQLNIIYITRGSNDIDPNEENPIVVSAARTEIITRKEIDKTGAVNISDVLRSRGGVIVSDRFGDGNATIDLRGFGESAGSNTLILVDGRRLNNSDISAPNLNSISLDNVERIEIIKGSAGSLYGDQAVGGVINIITKKIQGYDASIGSTVGSYNHRSINASVSNKINNQVSYRVYGEKLESDNYRENNESKSNHFFSKINYDNGKTKLFAEWQFDDREQKLPGSLLASEVEEDPRQSLIFFANDFQDRKEKTSRIGIEQRLTNEWSLLAEYTRRKEDNKFVNNFRGCDVPGPFSFTCSTTVNETDRDQDTFNPKLIGNYSNQYGRVVTTLGADFTDTTYDAEIAGASIERSNDQKIDSYYAQVIVPVASDTLVTLGGRNAKVKNNLTDLTAFPSGQEINSSVTVFSAGISKEIKSYRVFVRYDENFRFAKVDEQVFTETGTIGLETQEGKSKEIGIEYKKGDIDLALLVYRLDITNEIAFDPTVDGPFGVGTGANVNFDATLREGVIIKLGNQITKRLKLGLAYSILNSEFKSGIFTGNTISGIPKKIIRLSSDYQFNKHWNIFLEAQHNGNQYFTGDNNNASEKQASYTVSNLSINYQHKSWSLSGRVNNLNNRNYSESTNSFGSVNPSPERNFLLNVKYNFN
jgi:iron complex outermembrane receptor protein